MLTKKTNIPRKVMNRIGFTESDCPDLVCVHTGMLSKAGDVAACVPNKTVISVSGGEASVDTLTY